MDNLQARRVNEVMSNDAPNVSVKLRETTTLGIKSSTLNETCVGSLTSHRIYYICKDCETGPAVFVLIREA